jgi:hypothetical protein
MISISEIQGVRRYYEPIGCSMAISYHIFLTTDDYSTWYPIKSSTKQSEKDIEKAIHLPARNHQKSLRLSPKAANALVPEKARTLCLDVSLLLGLVAG